MDLFENWKCIDYRLHTDILLIYVNRKKKNIF